LAGSFSSIEANPAVADLAVAPQDRGRLPDLVRRQRIERMRVGH